VLLQLINHLFTAGEGGFAVVAAYGDDDGDISDGQFTNAVVEGYGVELVFRFGLFSDPVHFLQGHRGVAFEVEVGDRFSFIVVADGADEEDYATAGWVLDGGVGLVYA